MIVVENEIEIERFELKRKTTDGYLHIPEVLHNEIGKKLIRMALIENEEKIEIEIGKKYFQSSKNENPKKSNNIFDNGQKYLSPEEFEVFQKLMKKIERGQEIEIAKRKFEEAKNAYEKMLEELGE